MRRTTICRSRASIFFALTLTGVAAPATAWQNPPQPPAGQPAPAPTTPASVPAVHVVTAGESLWSLATQYFGDPLLWPEIYRLNTDIIEDPHWIFPGEELRLTGAAAVVAEQPLPGNAPTVITVTPQGDTTRPVVAPEVVRPTEGATIFSPRAAGGNTGTNLEVGPTRTYRGVSEGDHYSASFLTEGASLQTGRLLGNVQASSIRRVNTSTTAQLFTEVAIVPPDDSLRPGDLLLAVRRVGEIRGYGEVIQPNGLLRVTSTAIQSGRAAAQVRAMYGPVTDGLEVLRVARYTATESGRPVDVTDGMTGEVIALVKPGEVVNMQDAIFLNRGVQEGVRLGDVFQISGADRTRTDLTGLVLDQAQAMVVHVRPHTSTAVIVSLTRPDVRAGSTARLIRRTPS
jgi:hypothetical protein